MLRCYNNCLYYFEYNTERRSGTRLKPCWILDYDAGRPLEGGPAEVGGLTALQPQICLCWTVPVPRGTQMKEIRNKWIYEFGEENYQQNYVIETVAAIMILYRNTKVKVRSPDGDTEYFDIVAGVQQGDTLAPYLFIICLDYVLRTSIDKIRENGFELTKKRSRRHPTKTITDADNANDIAILANTLNHAETLLHSLERAAAGIGLRVNAHKTEYMCYNQTGDISTLDGSSLKLVDKFTYLGSSISSTEKDIDTRLTKAWTAIDRLSIIWKSDLTDKMKRSFFQAAVVSILLYGCTTWTLTKQLEKKLDISYPHMWIRNKPLHIYIYIYIIIRYR